MFSKPLAPEENYARMYSGTAVPPDQWPPEWRAYVDPMRPLPTYEGQGYELISKPEGLRMTDVMLVAVGAFTLGVAFVLLAGQVRRREV